MPSSSTDRHDGEGAAIVPPVSRRREPVRVQPFRALEPVPVPRPRPSSGLLPAAEVRPEPLRGGALRLRRAVALVVVLGTVCLAGYVASQRVAHGREPAAPGSLARP